MKSPVVYGNPVTFGAVDWNCAAGATVRRGKSVEELGDAGWARERERMAHMQQLQQLHQLQFQQQQVGYPGYGVVAPGHPYGPVRVASPSDPLPAPGFPMPVQGGVMVPVGGPVHVPAPWPVQPGNVCHQPSWEYNDQPKAAFKDRPQGQDVYFHPGSEDGHLELRISDWKGNHCFYQGPEDYNQQDYSRGPQEKNNNDFRTQQRYGKSDEDRRRRDDYVRENDNYSERYDHSSRRDLDDYDHKKKYSYRDHYDRKYDDYYDDREQQYYDGKRHHKYVYHREHDSYSSEYEVYNDHKDSYAHRDKYRDSDHYDDQDRGKESHRYREKDSYQRREEYRYYNERKGKDPYYDQRADERYDCRENISKERDVHYRRGEKTYSSKERGHDSEPDEHSGYKEKPLYSRYKDRGDDRRDEHCDHRLRDNYRAREHYERRPVDHCDYENEDRYESRGGERSHCRYRDRFRDLRSISVETRYEEYPKKDCKTHCEEWVEEQNKKFREMHSFEDPGVYHHSDEQERGYEWSAGSIGSKQGRKPVYVGSLDRNSFYRKTAPSSLRKSQFATTRRQNKGKHKDIVI